MRWVWVGVFTVGVAVVGCDDGERLPGEQVGTEGPSDDDDGDGASSSASTTGASNSTDEGPTTGPSDPTTGPTSASGGTTEDTSDGGESTGGAPLGPCVGETTNITQMGDVLASSVFDPLFGASYPADLSVDGDIATAWFSAGPNEDGTESSYEWYTQRDHCIDSIAIISNAMHANPDFREGFGFESATLEVIDSAGTTTFSQEIDLAGTPDPDITVEPGGAQGNQVRLRMREHESEDCGGFAELVIDARATR